MNEKQFVQAMIIAIKPKQQDFERALAYAQNVWGFLDVRGYGGDKQGKKTIAHRTSENFYALLSDRQKKFFDRFWEAYQHKVGRNNAAMRWGKLFDESAPMAEPTDDFYEAVISAAKKDSAKALPPGQVRKYPEGWLSEFRFYDYAPNTQQQQKNGQHELGKLKNELVALKRINTTGSLNDQIAALEKRISDAST